MKLYIHTDIEGVAGMVQYEDRRDSSIEGYQTRLRMQKLLTGEVNAATEGALDAGVQDILINDSHGSGNNFIFEELHPAVQLIHGTLTRQPFWMPCLDEGIDVLFCLAQHAMAHTNGILAHSIWYCNGYYFGEAGMAMALAGSYGIPTVLVTGDDTCCRQARDLVPEIETVAVKRALSPYNALTWTPARARDMVRDAARRAIERRAAIRPFALMPPFEIGIPSAPGQKPKRLFRGTDFVEVVKSILSEMYHYRLQSLPTWPAEPSQGIIKLNLLARIKRKLLARR